MPTVLITGANRGLGLELTRAYAEDGWQVLACCRLPEKASKLKRIGGDVSVHRLDVTDGLRVKSLARELAEEPIDLLINNAGVFGPRTQFGENQFSKWPPVFETNVVAPMRMAESFAPLVAASERKQIVNVSSRMGSVDSVSSSGAHAYRASKAALNMITKTLSIDLAEQGISVVSVHPGWVRTDMGGENADLTPAQSAANLKAVIDGLGFDDSGGFFSHDGEAIPF